MVTISTTWGILTQYPRADEARHFQLPDGAAHEATDARKDIESPGFYCSYFVLVCSQYTYPKNPEPLTLFSSDEGGPGVKVRCLL